MPAPKIDWNSDVRSIAAAQGLDFLDFNQFGIFPNVVLANSGVFTLSTGGDLGTQFYCRFIDSKKKTMYGNGLPMGAKDSEVCYSYDEQTSNGRNLEEILAGWRAAGYTPTKKNYLELVCQLDDGRVVLLSVPPASISRFTGFVAATITAQIPYTQARCRVYVGEKVTKTAVPFSPIAFDMVRG